ncbi:GYP5 [Candida theae]|uniref:GTPase-activating protein GYP5 n=1 Tax=Candida theae TaxID=1198502 RepID=A0AAD5BD43_9ASCO|nr:GYP5 [Candida theae]KAI5956618.1 GYP5 [Candida theae]
MSDEERYYSDDAATTVRAVDSAAAATAAAAATPDEETLNESPPLPSREPIQSWLHIDEETITSDIDPNTVSKLDEISHSYNKSSSNYLLQSKHKVLSIKFHDKTSNTQQSIESGAQDIRRTFRQIKNAVSVAGTPYNIDWDFWTSVVENYDEIVETNPDQVNNAINQGIPNEIRGIIWQIITKSKDSNLEDFYHSLKVEPSIHEKAIKRDLTRTSFYTNIDEFDKTDALFNVIKAYSLYDPDVGYTQGMIFIAVPLIMNMSESECFCLLVMLMKEYQLRDLFCPGMKRLHLLLYEFDCLLAKYSPVLYNHLVKQGIKASMYASQWFLTFFAYKFPLNIVLRIYDSIITQGMESILKFAVNLMIQNEDNLLSLHFDKLLQFLKDKLFNVYVSPEFIDIEEDAKSTKLKHFLTRRKSSHAPLTHIGASSYYRLDDLVHDSMRINIDPVELARFELQFNKYYEAEKLKLKDINHLNSENGKLRKTLKSLEFQYSNLNRDHVDIVQKMVDLKVTLPEIVNEIQELQESIGKLKDDITRVESKMGEESTKDILPGSIEDQIQKLLQINQKEVETAANLEDELATLVEQDRELDQQVKKSHGGGTWFKWNK